MKFLIALFIVNICFTNSAFLKNYRPLSNQDQGEQTQFDQNPTQVNQLGTNKESNDLLAQYKQNSNQIIQKQFEAIEQKKARYYKKYKTMITQEAKNQTINNQTQLFENGTESNLTRQINTQQKPTQSPQTESQQTPFQTAQIPLTFGQNAFPFGQMPFTFGQNSFQLFQIPNILSLIQNPFSQIQRPNVQIPNQLSQVQTPNVQIPNPLSQIQTPNVQIPNPFSQIPNLFTQVPAQYPIQFQPVPPQLVQTQFLPAQVPVTLPLNLAARVVTPSTCIRFPLLPICRNLILIQDLNEKQLTETGKYFKLN